MCNRQRPERQANIRVHIRHPVFGGDGSQLVDPRQPPGALKLLADRFGVPPHLQTRVIDMEIQVGPRCRCAPHVFDTSVLPVGKALVVNRQNAFVDADVAHAPGVVLAHVVSVDVEDKLVAGLVALVCGSRRILGLGRIDAIDIAIDLIHRHKRRGHAAGRAEIPLAGYPLATCVEVGLFAH